MLVAAFVLPRSSVSALERHPTARALVIGGAGVLLLPYAAGASHDYRLLFCLPILVGSLLWWSAAPGRAGWAPGIVVLSTVLSLVTGAAMIATPDDIVPLSFTWPKNALVVGDLALLVTLATGGGLWLRGWGDRDS